MNRVVKWCVLTLVVSGSIGVATDDVSAQIDSLVVVDSVLRFPVVPVNWTIRASADSSTWQARWSIDSVTTVPAPDWNAFPSVLAITDQAIPQNVRLTIQLIQANGFSDPDPAIAGVVDELEQLFRFEGYRLLAEATVVSEVPAAGSESRFSQRIAGTATDSLGGVFDLGMSIEPTRSEGVLRFDAQLLDMTREYDMGPIPVLSVSFTAREDQTIVIGSSKYDPEKPTLIVAFRMERMER